MVDRPEPVLIAICSTCDRPFEHHVDAAVKRLKKLKEADGIILISIQDEEITEEISFLDCIDALKIANRGPVGLVGPIGATGNPGKDAV